ncbi:MAG: hypothetical protein RJA07_1692 [Bacteroidota bacterium]|jgi:hypothetical protein
MKHLFILLLLIPFCEKFCNAQVNLVPNPSFELYDSCPHGIANYFYQTVSFANGWSPFGTKYGTPDYFDSCDNGINIVGVPTNAFGYQLPATGHGYCGFYAYYPDNYRELIGRQLSSNLTIGTKYYVSIKVSLSEGSICASNKIGVTFSTTAYNDTLPFPIKNSSKIYSSSILSDTSNWVIISGSFVADSAYRYIIIGNFFTNANTDSTVLYGNVISSLNRCYSYYYLDDICVSADSNGCKISDGINAINKSAERNNIFPNPASKTISFSLPMETQSITISDILGQKIYWDKIEPNIVNYTKDISSFPNGLYFLTIKTNNFSQTIKFIKQQ